MAPAAKRVIGLRGSQAQQRFGLGVEWDDAALSGYTPFDARRYETGDGGTPLL